MSHITPHITSRQSLHHYEYQVTSATEWLANIITEVRSLLNYRHYNEQAPPSLNYAELPPEYDATVFIQSI